MVVGLNTDLALKEEQVINRKHTSMKSQFEKHSLRTKYSMTEEYDRSTR
jgi:hypothetical protein